MTSIEIIEKYMELFKRFYANNAIESCFMKNECEGPIINAHSVQNSFVIDQLEKDGHVYVLEHEGNGEIDFKLKSRNKAGGFSGFCMKHDNQIFGPIDFSSESDVQLFTSEQITLFHFRALTREYWSKLNAIKCFKILTKAYDEHDSEVIYKVYPFLRAELEIDWEMINNRILKDALEGQKFGAEDARPYYESCLYQINNRKFHLTKGCAFLIDKSVQFAVCSSISPVVDFEGTPLNDFMSKKIHHMGINLFPNGQGKTHVILTWHRSSDHCLSKVGNQLLAMSPLKREISISKFIIAHSENIIWGREYIEKMPDALKSKITKMFIKTAVAPFFRLSDYEDMNLFSGF